MRAVLTVAAFDFVAATTWVLVSFGLREFLNPWAALATWLTTVAIGAGLLLRKNAARIIRIGFAIVSITYSVWVGFWAPYSPWFSIRQVLPEGFSLPCAEALTILYCVFVVWILTRPSTTRMFKRR
jgi:hypothetical protein